MQLTLRLVGDCGFLVSLFIRVDRQAPLHDKHMYVPRTVLLHRLRHRYGQLFSSASIAKRPVSPVTVLHCFFPNEVLCTRVEIKVF